MKKLNYFKTHKMISVSNESHKELENIKWKLRLSSIAEVIDKILKINSKSKKDKTKS